MKAVAEIQVVPIGEGTSVREIVKRAVSIIRESGLKSETHGFGTNVEGELALILETIETLHTRLHEEGTTRLVTYVKLGTRTDHQPTLDSRKL